MIRFRNPEFLGSLAQPVVAAASGAVIPATIGLTGSPVKYGPAQTTGTRTFADGTDSYLPFGLNNEYVQSLSDGTSWTTLRIGILAQITGTATTASGSRLIFALCSGSTHPWGQGTPTNVIGCNLTGRAFVGNPWTFNFQTGANPFFFGAGGIGGFKNVGGVITETEVSSTATDCEFPNTAGSTIRRGVCFLEIVKGSPNYTINAYVSSNVLLDVTHSTFETAIKQAYVAGVTPTVNGAALGQRTATIAATEVAGSFDHIDLFWNESTEIDVFEIGAWKIA